MRAAKFLGDGRVDMVEAPDPAPDDQSVIVRVRASALCGSELHVFREPRSADADYLNTGHEVAGEVVWAPPGSEFAVGTRVGACVVHGCGDCQWCRDGDDTACPNKRFSFGDGHSELFKLGLRGVRVLPDDADWRRGVLLSGDAIGVPARCARKLGDTAGKTVFVIGLGPVGLSSVLMQHWRGAKVGGVDISPYRIELAKKLGAEMVVHGGDDDVKAAVLEWTAGRGADIVILAVARNESLRTAFDVVRRYGTVYQLAELAEATINFGEAFIRHEAVMTGSWYYNNQDWPLMQQLHKDGLPYEKLITHEFTLDRTQEAFDTFVAGESGKVVLTYD